MVEDVNWSPEIKPAPDNAQAASEASLTPPGKERAQRALVVATNPATLRLCQNILEGFGLAVSAVDSGIAAVVAARESPPDLILVDGELRDVPGREALRWLQSAPELQSTRFIVLTKNAEENAVPVLNRSDPLLRKPLSPATLRCMIRDAFK